jgi:aspartate ammonia-lyase
MVELVGYEAATQIAQEARQSGRSIREIAMEKGLVTTEQFEELISPQRVTRLGSPLQRKDRDA